MLQQSITTLSNPFTVILRRSRTHLQSYYDALEPIHNPVYSLRMGPKKKKTSQTHENDQATMKTRYCGHLYSPLLRKRTCWDQRGWVSYCMEGGLKGT
jgi:hypothetical protein